MHKIAAACAVVVILIGGCAPAPVVDVAGEGAPTISWPSGPVNEIRVYRNDEQGNRLEDVWWIVCPADPCIESSVTLGTVPGDAEETTPIESPLPPGEYEVQTLTFVDDERYIFSDHFYLERSLELGRTEEREEPNPLAILVNWLIESGR